LTPEEFKELTERILANLDNQATVTTTLAELIEHNTTLAAESKKAVETAEKMTKDNETLRQANLDLFLKVGTEKKEKKEIPPEEDEKPSFDDLFDEDGELK